MGLRETKNNVITN